jgi:MATE family multidrug resistance protein
MEMLAIAAPVVATMTSFTLMQFVDKLMVSRIGPDPIYVGAQGNGGLASWAPISIAMGFVTVINTFVSQNLGAGKPDRGPAYVWAGIWVSLAYYLVVLVPLGLSIPWIFSLMRDADVAPEKLAEMIRRDAMASHYSQILIFAACFTLTCRAVSQFFYGMHTPMVVLVAGVAGNISNLTLNSFFIFGPETPAPTGIAWLDAWFHFCASTCASLHIPRLEVAGSAVATAIATLVELAIPLALFLSPKYIRTYNTLASWRPSLAHIKDLLNVGWAPALMFGNEMICWGLFMVYFVGHFGKEHSTAGWIAHQWMSLSFMPAVGISVAVTAVVGKALGAGKPNVASQRAWLGVKLAAGYMGLCGLVFVLFRHSLINLFIEDATPAADRALIVSLGSSFLIACACFQFFDGAAMTLTGALRGAGDTKVPGIVTLVLSWVVIVGGGLFMIRIFPQLGSVGPWITAAAYIIILATAMFARFISGKWKTLNLLQTSAGAVAESNGAGHQPHGPVPASSPEIMTLPPVELISAPADGTAAPSPSARRSARS